MLLLESTQVINASPLTSPWWTAEDDPSLTDDLSQALNLAALLVLVEAKYFKAIAVEESDLIVDAVDPGIVSCAFKGCKVLLDRIDALVCSAQREGNSITADASEAIEHDEFAIRLCRGGVVCDLPARLVRTSQHTRVLVHA